MSRFDVRDLRRRGRETGTSLRRRLLPKVTVLESRALLSTLNVTNANDSGSGSLSAAVAQANSDGGNDTIVFSSMFNTPQTITLSSPLTLTDSATTSIVGPGADLLNISGGGAIPNVLELDTGATAQISGLTLSGASVLEQFGGGAGVLNRGGTLEMNACTISGNTSQDNGGGIYNGTGSSLTLMGCSISGNSSAYKGGGIYNGQSASATITDCVISGNVTTDGGGIYSGLSATMDLKNVTISGNIASNGGGICEVSATSSLINCTISDNIAETDDGGGIFIDGPLTAINTIVANQRGGGDIVGALQSASAYNLVGDGSGMSGIENGTNGNQVGSAGAPINPLLSPLGNYGGGTATMGVLPGSPAYGAGTTGPDVPSTDQRGLPRSGRVDIGAFQSQGFTATLVSNSTPQFAVEGQPCANGLAVSVSAVNPMEPVDGGILTYTVEPASGGASATLSTSNAVIEGGQASVIATANGVTGAYSVTVSGPQIGSFTFNLTNTHLPLVVSSTQDNLNWLDDKTTLREAITYADSISAPSIITFSPDVFGTAPETITLTAGQLTLGGPAITINGPGATLLTVSGGEVNRVFDVQGGSATLTGLTISGGRADQGGGVFSDGANLSLTDVTVTGNSATTGGGMYIAGGTTSLTSVTISHNSAAIGTDAGSGGGLYDKGGTLTLTSSTINDNTAEQGGGLASFSASSSLTGCTVTGNTASLGGGGVYVSYGSATLKNVTVSSNQASEGGGVYRNSAHGTVQLTGCTLSGNTAFAGGGLYDASFGSLSLSDCTLSGNSANIGGGMEIDTNSVTLTNCTISNNSASNGGGLLNRVALSLANTIVAGNGDSNISGSFTDGGGNLTSANPLLAPLGNYGGPTLTMALLPGSPAIGGGIGSLAPLKDQRGESRSGPVDIGAFQSQGFTLTPEADSSPQSTVIGNTFAKPLAVTVMANNPVEPVDGGVISFNAPLSGASATLSAASTTIVQGDAGVSATALTTAGTYTVSASAGVDSASFTLTNKAGAPASVAVSSGSGQSATVSTGFAAPLVAAVTDSFGNPVPGVTVMFAAPASGASATLAGSPAVTESSGLAMVTAAAGTFVGSYTVAASVAGVTTGAAFMLTNTGGPQNLAAQPVAAVAGQSFTNMVIATFSDADPTAGPSEFTAGIDWGDGITTSNTTVIANGEGHFDVLGTHTYVNAGNYTFQVQITDIDGAVAKATSSAAVNAKKSSEAPSLVLTTARDVVDQFDNLTSLREAIAYANSHPGPDTITFDPSVFGKTPRTIVLTGGPLVLTDPATTTIVGPGDNLLTFKGTGQGPVFDIEGGSVALSGVTIAGGNGKLGGGLLNEGGTVSLNHVVVRDNGAVIGGGLYNDGMVTLNHVVIRGNRAKLGGGLYNDGTATLTNVLIHGNRARVSSRLFNTRQAIIHWRRAPVDRPRQARISIDTSVRT
jgi:hypothetical protein